MFCRHTLFRDKLHDTDSKRQNRTIVLSILHNTFFTMRYIECMMCDLPCVMMGVRLYLPYEYKYKYLVLGIPVQVERIVDLAPVI